MEPIYLNYAATSYKKPKSMTDTLIDFLSSNNHISDGRNLARVDNHGILLDTRMTLAKFFNVKNPGNILFTQNITMSLNMILGGLLEKGDHVITTSMEHNAVARPLHLLEQNGIIQTTYLQCSKTGELDPKDIEKAVKPETKLIIMLHASNVTGTILPAKECFEIAKKHGIITVLDAAQTAGFLPIDMQDIGADILAFTGHKSMLAISGVGGFCVTKEMAQKIKPWLTGGTGSVSDTLEQPEFLPDKFESGTPNSLGILSLGKSVEAVMELGLDKIRERELMITQRFLDGINKMDFMTVYGPNDISKMTPVVAVNLGTMDPAVLSQKLFEDHNIITRSGLHCSPLAHRTIGTFPEGSVRFSFGYETSEDEIDLALAALEKIYISL